MKPFKMTYPIYLIIEKWGKDIGGLILSFFYQCDECADLEIGNKYNCDICSAGMTLCRNCYEIKAMACIFKKCPMCRYCSLIHCLNHSHWWEDY